MDEHVKEAADGASAREPTRADPRPEPPATSGPTTPVALVVGHDRSPASDLALRTAADLARRLQAQVHVVHAVNHGDYPVDPESSDFEADAQLALADQHARVEAALTDHCPGWTYHCRRGNAIDLIRRIAEDVDAYMIIIGSRGENFPAALSRLLDRSVSHNLIGQQNRPVLVVPQPSR